MLRATLVRRPFSRRSLFFAAALAFCLLPAKALAQSQDVAEAARQEKARKAAAAKPEKKDSHVYTNEDLKRAQILTPEDHAQIEARKKNQTVPPSAQPADALDAAAPKASESLGEVARRYRREKAAREAEQALKIPQRMPLPAELAQPALASPRPLHSQPLTPLVPPAKPARPSIAPPPGRRDPFSRPSISGSPVSPSRAAQTAPASPRITIKSPALGHAIAPRTAAPAKPLIVAKPALSIDPHTTQPSALIAVPTRPQPHALAPPAGNSRVTVQPGDSLWKLARLHLGKGARWRDFLSINPGLPSPNRLPSGRTLLIPAHNSLSPRTATRSAASSITVQRGDSLWRIAAAQFGTGTYWFCLAQANPQLQDADHIYPGQMLSLPATCRLAP